jgi:hypothetical protein
VGVEVGQVFQNINLGGEVRITFAKTFSKLAVTVVFLGAVATGQIVTDDAYTSSSYPTQNFGSGIALIVGSGSNSYVKVSLANLGTVVTSSNISKATHILYTDYVLTSGTMDVYLRERLLGTVLLRWGRSCSVGCQ